MEKEKKRKKRNFECLNNIVTSSLNDSNRVLKSFWFCLHIFLNIKYHILTKIATWKQNLYFSFTNWWINKWTDSTNSWLLLQYIRVNCKKIVQFNLSFWIVKICKHTQASASNCNNSIQLSHSPPQRSLLFIFYYQLYSVYEPLHIIIRFLEYLCITLCVCMWVCQ